MVEQLPVKQQDESSSLSSSANCEYTKVGGLGSTVNRVPIGLVSSNLTTHTQGESPVGRGSCLENS